MNQIKKTINEWKEKYFSEEGADVFLCLEKSLQNVILHNRDRFIVSGDFISIGEKKKVKEFVDKLLNGDENRVRPEDREKLQ